MKWLKKLVGVKVLVCKFCGNHVPHDVTDRNLLGHLDHVHPDQFYLERDAFEEGWVW